MAHTNRFQLRQSPSGKWETAGQWRRRRQQIPKEDRDWIVNPDEEVKVKYLRRAFSCAVGVYCAILYYSIV